MLTAMPNYPRGKRLPGVRRVSAARALDGVSVARTWIYPTQSVGFVKRLWNYFSFVLSSLFAGPVRLRQARLPDHRKSAALPRDLRIRALATRAGRAGSSTSPISGPRAPCASGVLREGASLGRPSASRRSAIGRPGWSRVRAGKSSRTSAVVSPSCPRTICRMVSTPRCSLPRDVRRAAREALLGGRDEDTCLAVYAGLHGIAQGLDQVLDAASLVRNGPLRIVLVGDGPEKARLERRSRELDLSNLRFLEARSREAMPELMASADIAIVPLKLPLPGAVPSKLYEAMGAGAAVVLVADGEAASVVRESGAGIVVSPGDVRGLAGALERLATDAELCHKLGRAGRATVARAVRPKGDRGRLHRTPGGTDGMLICSVVGARPNFMKMAPVVRELRRRGLRHLFVHTGQHYDAAMSRVFFEDLGLPEPDVNLGVGSDSPTPPDGTDSRGVRGGLRARAARPRPRRRGRHLDGGRRAGRRAARDPPRPRRVRAALVRPDDARGDQPRRHGSPLRRTLHDRGEREHEPRSRGDPRRARALRRELHGRHAQGAPRRRRWPDDRGPHSV